MITLLLISLFLNQKYVIQSVRPMIHKHYYLTVHSVS